MAGFIAAMAALALGLLMDPRGFIVNVLAGVFVIGIGLLVSNYLIAWFRIQEFGLTARPLARKILGELAQIEENCIEQMDLIDGHVEKLATGKGMLILRRREYLTAESHSLLKAIEEKKLPQLRRAGRVAFVDASNVEDDLQVLKRHYNAWLDLLWSLSDLRLGEPAQGENPRDLFERKMEELRVLASKLTDDFWNITAALSNDFIHNTKFGSASHPARSD